MTSTDVDAAFIKQFEREVHEAYQRQGSKLRNFVRRVNNVMGSSATFQKVGKGTAATKTRKGKVPLMNVSHTPVECDLVDYYAGDYVDKLDELKTNIDERAVITNAGAYALGRKTDELIIDALDTAGSGQTIAVGGTGMTLAKAQSMMELLGDADVPDDGSRVAVVGWKQWSELLAIEEFSNSQWAGDSELPLISKQQAKFWMGALWIPHSGLSKTTTTRHCMVWHPSAVGHASGSDVTSDITWQGDYAAHFVNNMMSQGAVLIDEAGVARIDCNEP